MNIIILAAGLGSRFSKTHILPKPLIVVDNKPMVISAALSLGFEGKYYFIIRHDEYTDQLIEMISSDMPESEIIILDELTGGPAQTALIARHYIDNDDELIIANCDQIMNWNHLHVIQKLRKYDAGVITVTDIDPKHSYVVTDENDRCINFVEKEVISNNALTGIHYWKKGKYFVESASSLIRENKLTRGEFYIAPTYNYLVNNLTVGNVKIENKEINFIGTPEDLNRYENS